MAYDRELADRVREELAGRRDVVEKTMFGGQAFLIQGNLACTASSHGGLMLRVDPTTAVSLLEDPHAERVVMRGREMAGWLRIAPDGVASDGDLTRWVAVGVARALALPWKSPKK